MVRIARSRPGDAAALTAIAFAAKRHWGYPEDWIQRWTDILTLTPEYIRSNPTFSAIEGEEIVGFCALRLTGAEAAVDHLWVTPASMGKGIGSALFRHCEGEARKAGAAHGRVGSPCGGLLPSHGFPDGRAPAGFHGRVRALPAAAGKEHGLSGPRGDGLPRSRYQPKNSAASPQRRLRIE